MRANSRQRALTNRTRTSLNAKSDWAQFRRGAGPRSQASAIAPTRDQQEGERMDTTLIVATGHGIFTYERNEHDWRARAFGLDGQNVTSAIAREGVILAGTTNGVFRSDDSGEQWHAARALDGVSSRSVGLRIRGDGTRRDLRFVQRRGELARVSRGRAVARCARLDAAVFAGS